MNFKKITLIASLLLAILACSFTAAGNPSPSDTEIGNNLLQEEEPSDPVPPATPENNSELAPIFGENLLADTGFQTVVPHEDVTINNAGNIIALPTQSGVEFFDLLLQEPIELDLEGFPPDPIRAWETRWSHDGSMLASLISGDIYIWETSTGSQLMRSEAPQAYHLAWSPNDSQLATADVAQRGIVIWDVNTGEAIWESAEYYHRTSHIAWSPNGDFLVQQGGGQFYVWDAETFEVITTLGKKAGPTILFMDWAPDNTLVYFNFTDSALTFVNPTNWETTVLPITTDNYGPHMALAPDGTKFAFGLADGSIEIRNYDDLEIVEVFGMHSRYVSQIVWSPDSQSLISLSLYDRQANPTVWTEIMMWQLGKSNEDLEFDLSEADTINDALEVIREIDEIAYVVNRAGPNELKLMQISDGASTVLTSAFDDLRRVAWSPDGESLVFMARETIDSDYEIYVIDRDGSNLKKITDNTYWDGTPSWSSDGNKILFASEREGNWEIYSTNLMGDVPKNISEHSSVDVDPISSPDGRSIAFTSNRNGSADIFLLDLARDEITQLTDTPGNISMLAWSPNGRQIAFSYVEDEVADIYIVDINGENMTNLTMTNEWDGYPGWIPGTSIISFTSIDSDGKSKIIAIDIRGNVVPITILESISGFNAIWRP